MEMKNIHSGKLRAIGYDARTQMLQVQLDELFRKPWANGIGIESFINGRSAHRPENTWRPGSWPAAQSRFR